jgi:S-(hydroxymethyl)glutathione dehydrogenase/alcohol dehydrogenase
MSCFLRGAAIVFSIDHWPTRLKRTKDLGAETINFDDEDPVEVLKKETRGKGAICIDAVGFESVGHLAGNTSNIQGNRLQINGLHTTKVKGHDHSKVNIPAYQPLNPIQVITWMAQVAKKYSTISIPGVYPTSYDQFPLGLLFNRNVSIHMGQCPVKKYSEQLFHLVETKRIDPTKVISHTMKLTDAPVGYERMDKKEDVMKIVLKP